MMYSTTRMRRLVDVARNGASCEVMAEILATIPVAAKDQSKKQALIKELKALDRRKWACVEKLNKLPIEKRLVK